MVRTIGLERSSDHRQRRKVAHALTFTKGQLALNEGDCSCREVRRSRAGAAFLPSQPQPVPRRVPPLPEDNVTGTGMTGIASGRLIAQNPSRSGVVSVGSCQ